MGIRNSVPYYVMIPIKINAFDYDEDTALNNQYGKYYKYKDRETVRKREFIVVQEENLKRMQMYS